MNQDPTGDHNAANVRQAQGVDDLWALGLHQVLHHHQPQELHVSFHFRPATPNPAASAGTRVRSHKEERFSPFHALHVRGGAYGFAGQSQNPEAFAGEAVESAGKLCRNCKHAESRRAAAEP